MLRVTAGVEAHTHEYIATAHEDQKFGFSITDGEAMEAVRRVQRRPGPRAGRAALPHRLPDLRHLGLRGRRPPGARAARAGAERARDGAARAGPRRRLRHRLHHPGRPRRARRAGDRDDQDRRARVPGARHRTCPGSRSSPAGRSSARRRSRSTRSAPSRRSRSTAERSGTYVSVDGGMSDNIRTALYDADYSCTLASRASDAPPALSPDRRQALRVRRHRGQGRVPAERRRSGRPGRRPGHRCLLPVAGHQLQPRTAAAGGRGARRCRARRRTARDRGRLLATDMGDAQ